MKPGNAAIELAEHCVELEREAGIARARAALTGHSARFTCACGQPIGGARRSAMPNAKDCIDCATFLERQRRRA